MFKGIKAINERTAFIDVNDALNIKITANRATYKKRDSVSLSIDVKDKSGFPVQGSFSLSVTDDSQVKPDTAANYGIAASLLINSELKGYIESPGYYINRTDKQAWKAPDNLLLTRGWTGYDWKDVFTPAKPVAFPAEKEFKVSGYVINLSHNPIPGIEMILSSQKPQFVTTGITDSSGRFVFKNLPAIDSGSFFIRANNKRGRSMFASTVAVDRFKAPPVISTANDPVLPRYVNTDSTTINNIRLKAQKQNLENLKLSGIVLKEVQIKSTKIIKGAYYRGGANLTFDEEDIKKSTTTNLYDLLKLYVPGFKIIRDWKYRHGAVTMKIGDEDFIEPYDLILDNTKNIYEALGGAEILTNTSADGEKKERH
ncbi:carboxypeptidase regulatory-like domain-containing protein [Mucilaginibacter sp. S1162]|uniref:Carboxypeptidase regulatory-like domain-containing protein n=1 Tax=Mucilaginibacter humi TaxID=2732510 RepID=A0ABX1W1B3_9SPHI|nr:carboxypeptidase-like regulatory domain-containing protein [Mucilaginibacter humi]NNU33973.1 carboxypeptidase regulatory-like domain-containing protein [Mucilaginibacter humi]